jgi:hypothetical protein
MAFIRFVALAKPEGLSYYQAILNGGQVTRLKFSWPINRLMSACHSVAALLLESEHTSQEPWRRVAVWK